ncbi:protein kinase [bacterium]|nr:protein kinase [bacterium]
MKNYQTNSATDNKTLESCATEHDFSSSANSEKAVTDEIPGRYEIFEELARGGSGRVLLVFDKHIGRKVAMKELLSDLVFSASDKNDPQVSATRNRFLREAKLTGRLEHPAIVPVYEIGRHPNGTFYYTMRLIKGTTLLKAIKKCGSIEERLELLHHFYNICNAVAYSHSKGVINRDLKPSNVMIGEFGETVVLDWGLAKIKDSDEMIFVQHEDFGVGKTVIGQAIGTPSYMSPEQAEGRIGEIDETSDIYSLGAILYQILTGRPPFSGKSVDEIISKVMTEKAENAVKREKNAPPELAAIAEKALSKDKGSRYSSVTEMLEDLTSYMSGRKVRVYRYSLFESLKFMATRHKAAFLSSLIILATVLFASVQIMFALNRATAAKNEAEHDKVTANYRTAQAFSEKSNKLDIEKSYITSRIYAAAAMYYDPKNKKSPEYDPEFAARSKEHEEILSNAVSKFYIKNFHRGAIFEKDIYSGCVISSSTFSEEGKIIAAGCKNGEVALFNFPALSQIYRFNLEHEVRKFRFSPDGRKLYVLLSNNGIFEISINEKRAERFSGKGFETYKAALEDSFSKWYQKENDKIETKTLSPDGKMLFAGTEKGRIAVFSATNGKLLKVQNFRNSAITDINFQSGGGIFIAASKEGKSVVWDSAELIPLFVIDGHNSPVRAAFFAGKDHIVTAGEDGLLRIWKTYGKKETKLFDSAFVNLRKALSAKGFKVITLSGEREISIVSKNKSVSVKKFEEKFPVSDVDTSEDGDFIAVSGANGTLKLHNFTKNTKKELKLTDSPVHSVKISPSVNFIAAADGEKIHLVSPETLETKSFPCKNATPHIMDFSPDGKEIAAVCDGIINLLSVPELETKNKIEIEGRKAVSLKFTPKSDLIAGFDKGFLSRIDTSANSIMDFSGKFEGNAGIAVSKDALFAATTAEHSAVKLWNIHEHSLVLTIPTEKDPECVLFEPEKNSLGICVGGEINFYPLEIPDLNLSPLELLNKTERDAGMKLRDFYLETLTSDEIQQKL